ncbi:efflux RND transporter permease subunit [Neptuniibacter sp. QD37_11]|uniref:efflux RND transporter permease subunit n=1 Tax=Neptuniibacter sp. QD37_11 TaxID=3398209 RepID=UPI0039F60730
MFATIFSRFRVVLLLTASLFLAGLSALSDIPKEDRPDISLPIIQVSTGLSGISPQEADRDLARPLISSLKTLEGLKHIDSTSQQGSTAITLTMESGVDIDTTLINVREKLSQVKNDLPSDANEPVANEVNVSLFPIVQVAVRHDDPIKRQEITEILTERLEAIREVLEVREAGGSEMHLSISMDPQALSDHNITFAHVGSVVDDYVRLAPLGSLGGETGRWSVQLENGSVSPSALEEIVLIHNGEDDLKLRDIADIELKFKDPTQEAWVDGKPATVISVVKRTGKNLLNAIDNTKLVVEEVSKSYPDASISVLQDSSEKVERSLNNLINNVLISTLIVGFIIILFMGLIPGLMVAFTVPLSFLLSIFAINQLGYTLNIVTFFGLILSIGLLVDCAIVVVEYAEKQMRKGANLTDAFITSAKHMFWPIVTSTVTTLCAFIPLLAWPNLIGSFMFFIPMALICTLSSALIASLIVLPSMAHLSRRGWVTEEHEDSGKIIGAYRSTLSKLIQHPLKSLSFAVFSLVLGVGAFAAFNQGVVFFPSIDAEQLLVTVEAKGNLSDSEKRSVSQWIDAELESIGGIKHSTTTVFYRRDDAQIATALLELEDWYNRPKGSDIKSTLTHRLGVIGSEEIEVKVDKPAAGPSSAHEVEFYLTGANREALLIHADKVKEALEQSEWVSQVVDDTGRSGKQTLTFKPRSEHMRMSGVSQMDINQSLQAFSEGIKLGETRVSMIKDEIEIRGYYQTKNSNVGDYKAIWIPQANGAVPLSEVVDSSFEPAKGIFHRHNGDLSVKISASLKPEFKSKASVIMGEISGQVDQVPGLTFIAAGDAESQAETSQFLMVAFLAALFCMVVIMTIQFNSIKQSLIVMSGIIFGLVAILVAITIKQTPFVIVMNGMGVIALAGIIINNNIILVDAFNSLKGQGLTSEEAALEAAASRVRPVMLTALTTVMGLLPMMLGLGIDLINKTVSLGSPDSLWWIDLSYAIGAGMLIASVMTLLVTPVILSKLK